LFARISSRKAQQYDGDNRANSLRHWDRCVVNRQKFAATSVSATQGISTLDIKF
jgi:hypothetical protein